MAAPSSNNSPPDKSSSNTPSGQESSLLRFGVFELDRQAEELRKSGKLVRLRGHPFQVLVILLENAGHVIPREHLRERIWPSDTFVDFDHSLNTAVNKIREALGDSATSPRFVETLARRGYRFIAPVSEWQGGAPASLPESSPSEKSASLTAIPPATNPGRQRTLHPELHVPVPHRGLVRALFGLIQVMFLTFYLVALSHLQEVERISSVFLGDGRALLLVVVVLLTGTLGIPVRCYLISAVAFDFRKLGATFRRLFPFVLAIDELWAVAPFLLLPQIGVGLTFAATAALIYVPFSERTLVRMAYPDE